MRDDKRKFHRPDALSPVVLLSVIVLPFNDRFPPNVLIGERSDSAATVGIVIYFIIAGCSTACQREAVDVKVAGGGRDVENPRQVVAVDRHVSGERRGFDRERLRNLQFQSAKRKCFARERSGKVNRIGTAASDRAIDAGVGIGCLNGFT